MRISEPWYKYLFKNQQCWFLKWLKRIEKYKNHAVLLLQQNTYARNQGYYWSKQFKHSHFFVIFGSNTLSVRSSVFTFVFLITPVLSLLITLRSYGLFGHFRILDAWHTHDFSLLSTHTYTEHCRFNHRCCVGPYLRLHTKNNNQTTAWNWMKI